MKTEKKYCQDCKHYSDSLFCNHPKNLYRVNGNLVKRKAEVYHKRTLNEMRMTSVDTIRNSKQLCFAGWEADRYCGKEGRFWEPSRWFKIKSLFFRLIDGVNISWKMKW